MLPKKNTADYERAMSVDLGKLEAQLASSYASETAFEYTGDITPEDKDRIARIIGKLKRDFDDWLQDASETLRVVICVEARYCELRDSDPVNLAIAIADNALMLKFGTVLPIASLAAYVVRRKWLDPYCQCAE